MDNENMDNENNIVEECTSILKQYNFYNNSKLDNFYHYLSNEQVEGSSGEDEDFIEFCNMINEAPDRKHKAILIGLIFSNEDGFNTKLFKSYSSSTAGSTTQLKDNSLKEIVNPAMEEIVRSYSYFKKKSVTSSIKKIRDNIQIEQMSSSSKTSSSFSNYSDIEEESDSEEDTQQYNQNEQHIEEESSSYYEEDTQQYNHNQFKETSSLFRSPSTTLSSNYNDIEEESEYEEKQKYVKERKGKYTEKITTKKSFYNSSCGSYYSNH